MPTRKASQGVGSASFAFVFVMMLVSWSSEGHAIDPVKEGFEGSTIARAFVPCARPENNIAITRNRARSGKQSLALIIARQPLFAQTVRSDWSLNPASCLIPSEELRYWSDDSERAECSQALREKRGLIDARNVPHLVQRVLRRLHA